MIFKSQRYETEEDLEPNQRRVSELRRDLVTGAWVVIASARHDHKKKFVERSVDEEKTSKRTCPFEDPQASGNGEPLLMYGTKKDWRLQVIHNKFPAFAPSGQCVSGDECKVGCNHTERVGPYTIRDGYGFHEVVITRDHYRYLALFSKQESEDLINAYLERYTALSKEDCVRYISVFQNHGKAAGASLFHPHSQIIAVPFLPSDIKRSLNGSRAFHRREGNCPHCIALSWEQEQKERIIFENEHFIAFCPFVSFSGFEIRIFPKKHEAHFNNMTPGEAKKFGDALRSSLAKLNNALDNPPYNFFIHTAPVGGKRDYSYYHWHIEILPKLSIDAGFELGTGVQITILSPEHAASLLGKSSSLNTESP